jgi:hypothetical protein
MKAPRNVTSQQGAMTAELKALEAAARAAQKDITDGNAEATIAAADLARTSR